jgi:hypothetical protein
VLESCCEKGHVDDNADVETIENHTEDKALQLVIVMEVDRPVDIGALNDDFDLETFVEDDGNGDGTHEMDDIS